MTNPTLHANSKAPPNPTMVEADHPDANSDAGHFPDCLRRCRRLHPKMGVKGQRERGVPLPMGHGGEQLRERLRSGFLQLSHPGFR